MYVRSSTRGSFFRTTLTAPFTKRRRHFFGFGPVQIMTESAVVTHTGTKTFKHILSLFSLREPPPVSLNFFLRVLTLNASSLNRPRDLLKQKGTTVSKTDGSRKSPRKCGLDKRTRSRFWKNCTTHKASFNTCKCSKRQRTGTYSFWTGAYKRRNETSSRIRR